MAPATSPATPVNKMLPGLVLAAATPTTRLAVETMPSFGPEHGGTQPANAVGAMALCVGAPGDHDAID
jgi:hypothetical protein